MSDVAATASKVIANVEKVIIGKRQQLVLALVSYFCEGHILLEDVPGVAKTMLARALAKSVGCSFKRLQCTPDLLPTDVTGVSIFNQKTAEFEFRPGPIFAQIVLTDEINRTTPRTQSALLEAMAERRVTVDGQTYNLTPPFLVIATQNPIDHEGTFPLPEAQLDRFLVRLSLGYPGKEEEGKMLERLQHGHPIDELAPDRPGSGGHQRPQFRPARRHHTPGPRRAGPSPDPQTRKPAPQSDPPVSYQRNFDRNTSAGSQGARPRAGCFFLINRIMLIP